MTARPVNRILKLVHLDQPGWNELALSEVDTVGYQAEQESEEETRGQLIFYQTAPLCALGRAALSLYCTLGVVVCCNITITPVLHRC